MAKTLKDKYTEEMVPALMNELGYKNRLQIPRVEKVVINVGIGDGAANAKLLEVGLEELNMIAGQKPVVTRAKKSVAGFKVREGMPIGAKVTLRGERMWDFLSKLIGVVLPRIRDFRGISPKGFDGQGNYNLGLKDQLVFPEINYDKVQQVRGMNITIVTTANNDIDAKALMTQLGFPFRKVTVQQAKTEEAKAAS